MKHKTLQILAVILIIEIGLVHYFSAQHEYEEAAVLGYLFVANFPLAAGHHLVQETQGIPHASPGLPRNKLKTHIRNPDAFL